MAVVVFDIAAFRARYPEFSKTADATLQAAFNDAQALYLDNTDGSPVTDVVKRAALLNLLVAHLLMLTTGNDDGPSVASQTGMSGQVTSVSEGSVSISAAALDLPGQAAWYALTRYGAMFWQATAIYRTMKYIPGRSYPQQRMRGYGWPYYPSGTPL